MNYKALRYRFPAVFVIGSEKRELSEKLLEAADFVVRIAMRGGCDSINAAAATRMLLFEMTGQTGGLAVCSRQLEYRRFWAAADAIPLPEAKPRAMREHFIVSLVRGREVAWAERSVGHREDAL
jgi:SpoU rRNA methylase family protein